MQSESLHGRSPIVILNMDIYKLMNETSNLSQYAIFAIHWCSDVLAIFFFILKLLILQLSVCHQEHQNCLGFQDGEHDVIEMQPHAEHNYSKSFYPETFTNRDPPSPLRTSAITFETGRVVVSIPKSTTRWRPTSFQ